MGSSKAEVQKFRKALSHRKGDLAIADWAGANAKLVLEAVTAVSLKDRKSVV